MKSLYFDHNATSPTAPEVTSAMHEILTARLANPASAHHAGRRARQVLEEAREAVGRMLGAEMHSSALDRVIFTSGGTEANNLAIFGLVGRGPGHVIISSIEHPSLVGPAEELQRRGWEIERLPVSRDGVVSLDALQSALRPGTQLVSVMLANNETGVVQPVREISQICSQAGVPMHTDAVQAAGKLDVRFRELNVSAMTISAHKLGGPVGVGALVLRHGVELRPLHQGGFQQLGARPGTESVALAVGLRAALELWECDRAETVSRLTGLRDQFERELQQANHDIVINGQGATRLPHVSNVSFVGTDREATLMALDLAGVACSTGSACASGSSEPSPTLRAMQLSEGEISSALRFSFGRATTAEEIDEGASRIIRVYNELRSQKSGRNSVSAGRKSAAKTL